MRNFVPAASVALASFSGALAQVTPEESLKLLKPAEGFEVSLWAHEPMVNNPTGMDIDSRGRVWIAEGLNYRLWAKREDQFERVPGADRVRILHDTDGDGRADACGATGMARRCA